jgi:hypothetical protein
VAGIHRALALRHEVKNLLDSESFTTALRMAWELDARKHRGRFQSTATARVITAHQELRAKLQSLDARRAPEDRLLADGGWSQRRKVARREAAWATVRYPLLRPLSIIPVMLFKAAQSAMGGFHTGVRRLSNMPAGQPAPRGALKPEERPDPAQNPMVLIANVTGGKLGVASLRLILRSINVRFLRYLSGLNDIKTIHCARWLILDNARTGRPWPPHHRMLFFSNYDGSWESYIDSFLDHKAVRKFLELIWAQTDAFPRRKKGRPFVRPFKDWIHRIEVPVLVWYSAFQPKQGGALAPRTMAAADVQNALSLRELLLRERMDRPLRDYLARRLLREFLARGTCDPERLPMFVGAAVVRAPARVLRDLRDGARKVRRFVHESVTSILVHPLPAAPAALPL